MTTISTADFKNGMGIQIDGKDYVIVEFQHVKPGKGGAFVRTKIRDLRTGRTNELTFNAGKKFEDVRIETKEMQYLYQEGDIYWFMDNETYDQIPVASELVGESWMFLKENDTCLMQYANGNLYAVQPPMFIEVEIAETEPGFKGDTVQAGTKPAKIATGATIQVPMFLNIGDVIKVDTREGGKYVSRV